MSTAATRERNKRSQANKRARDEGRPEPYAKIDHGMSKIRLEYHEEDFAWAKQQDETGNCYLSECRSYIDLLAIYEGADINSKEDEDGEANDSIEAKRKAGRKKNQPNPSQIKIEIRAVEYEGLPLEPDCDFEFRKLKEVDEVVRFRRWLELRDKARKDLFWLGRLLGCSLFHNTHQMVCDMFVRKNFDGMYFKGNTKDDIHDMIGKQKRFANDGVTPTRTMLLFAPRSGYKSTIDGLDVVQWMLNCPDIRVMIMTSVKNLAKMFMMEIKSYFRLRPRAIPTAFQLLFPEYVLTGIDAKSKEPITCPAQVFNSKEPHVWITSMDASSVGGRCDIRKMDDPVETKNSSDDELRETLKQKIGDTNNLVEGWGFTDVIGTRYFTRDWYGWRMSKDEHGNEPAPFSFLSISAWTPREGYKARYAQLLAEPNGLFQVTEEMVDLWFPSKLSFAVLRTLLRENKERGFKNQQLNIATDPIEMGGYVNHFDEVVLRAHSYPESSAPAEGDVFILWDWAYSDRATSDYSVGAVVRIYKRLDGQYAVCVLQIIYGKWKSSELVYHIINLHRKWKPKMAADFRKKVVIEKANGAELLEDNIKIYSKRLESDIVPDILWVAPTNESGAKSNRVKSLELLLESGRLHFVNGDWIDETFKQLTAYTGEKSTAYRKDDIPDALGYVAKILPQSALRLNASPEEIQREAEAMDEKVALAGQYQRVFGGPSPTTSKPAETDKEPQPDPRRAILSKILPSGMRA